ncbi:MAG: YeeE/YedE thiosulfate transporter family protein [Terrimicrobiaceae bacterium]
MLQRGRFCYFCVLREAVEERETRPLLGLLLALAAASVGAAIVFDAWIPDARAGSLPPSGSIGPVGWPLLLGGLTFGLGMAFSGSCISAHLYRLAEGSWLAPVALLGVAAGFALGFVVWNPFYLSGYRTAPLVWLPATLGLGGALLLQLILFAALAWWLWHRWHRPVGSDQAEPFSSPLPWSERLWVRRWPVWASALGVAAVATVLLFRAEPIGVTSALGSAVRSGGDALGWWPERLEGLDGFRGCRTAPAESWLSLNAVFVLALVAGAFAASLAGGHFRPERPPVPRLLSAALGGLLLGFGAMISLGCTVGRLTSGISALSLCGWLFAVTMLLGILLGLRLRRPWWPS